MIQAAGGRCAARTYGSKNAKQVAYAAAITHSQEAAMTAYGDGDDEPVGLVICLRMLCCQQKFGIPFGVQDIKQLFCIHLLGGSEHHNLIQLGHPLQKLKQKGPLPDGHGVLSPIEGDCEVEVCCFIAVQG